MNFPMSVNSASEIVAKPEVFLKTDTVVYRVVTTKATRLPLSWGNPPTMTYCDNSGTICGRYLVRGTIAAHPTGQDTKGEIDAVEIVEISGKP
jgi:hypothetical protein